MPTLFTKEARSVSQAIDRFTAALAAINISIEVHHDFKLYASIRRQYGDSRLNQAFDPQHTCFGAYDFWLRARRECEEIGTCCTRRVIADDFYELIRTQALWFSRTPELIQWPIAVDCKIPPFGGEIVHSGGLWVRQDLRGWSRLASVLPRLARALSLRERAFDHDTGMIRSAPSDTAKAAARKAEFAAVRTYGFARVSRFVDGWFPPEGRNAVMHLCHSTKAEAVASLLDGISGARSQSSRLRSRVPVQMGRATVT